MNQNLETVVTIAVDVANVADEIGHDNKSGLARYAHLTELFGDAVASQKIDFAAAKAELSTLDAAGRADLEGIVKAKLNLGDKKLENEIEELIDIADAAFIVVQRAVVLVKNLKA